MWRVRKNFGRNVVFSPAHVYTPRSEDEVLDILRRHRGQRIRCMGAGHSWSRVAATNEVLVDLAYFNEARPIGSGPPYRRVQVGAGCTLGLLLERLHRYGLTVPTLGAVLHQTVAGAISTGTHGSGLQSLSHFVEGVRLAAYDSRTGDPTIVNLHEGDDLRAARCSLGSMGIILRVVLLVEPQYLVEERQEMAGPARPNFDPEWPLSQFALFPWRWEWLAFRRRRTELPRSALRAFLQRWAAWLLVDIGLHIALKMALRLGLVKKLYRALPVPAHHRVDFSDAVLTLDHARFRHVEMELFVPQRHFGAAMGLIRSAIEHADAEGWWTQHYPISCRRVLPDDALMSMTSASAEPWVAISLFTYDLPVTAEYERFARAVAATLRAHCEARLHWGKYSPLDLLEAANDYGANRGLFEDACARYDADGFLWNENLWPRGSR